MYQAEQRERTWSDQVLDVTLTGCRGPKKEYFGTPQGSILLPLLFQNIFLTESFVGIGLICSLSSIPPHIGLPSSCPIKTAPYPPFQ